ncbi:MAG: hypothetical protein DMF56_12810 [Acidobacteria bacterium]|nr:MAG: hypothetical protein DMF56_12810 [Acidobacteriota bacterium]
MTGRARVLLLCILALTSPLFARVLSYAPYTNRTAIPSLNHRSSRWFALTERTLSSQVTQVVLYDALGFEEPRVIYDTSNVTAAVVFVAVYENRFLLSGPGPATASILIGSQQFAGQNWKYVYDLSVDGGRTFKHLDVLDGAPSNAYVGDVDYGGPYSHGLSATAGVIVGDFYPFIVSTTQGIYTIDYAGHVKLLIRDWTMIGRNRDGSRVLVHNGQKVAIVDMNGVLTEIGAVPPGTVMNGWITDQETAYVQPFVNGWGVYRYLYFYSGGQKSLVGAPYDSSTATSDLTFFAVPTSDYNGAWMIQRQSGKPTKLSRHTLAAGTEVLWTDVSGPEVEALHTAGSPDKLLIQVHRRRAQVFIDPALALWRVGEPAPTAYDELFLNESVSKGFVHVDVDNLASGAPFAFDSGVAFPSIILSGGGGGAGGGGGDVVQEWGVVRGSLKQRLVLPGIARQAGAFGSYWLTDVVVQNPLDEPQNVDFRFAPTGALTETAALTIAKTVTLAPKQIAVYNDVMKSLFDINSGGGVLIIEPKVSVTATARTYTRAANGGAFGFGMQAIDFLNAASPRFPVTFSGAFPGAEFRTNMLLTDTSGRGTEARLRANGFSGFIGVDDVMFGAPANGVQQMNGIGGSLGLTQNDSGGLTVQPARGSMIVTVVAMDNRTNDPTFFPPDLPASVTRTIPAIGHVDGANGSKFRSDLYLLNPASTQRQVFLEAKRWDTTEAALRASFTLQPGEARVYRDVLPTLFGVTGIARLRVTAPGEDGVRVTSRTYNINEDGGTFGSLVPPLNSFQSAGAGEKLEILGITADSGSRTNLGLVEMQANANGQTSEARVHIVDHTGKELDAFTVTLPIAGGTQINNLFETRGIAQPQAAIVYVEVVRGWIGAYATLTDNITNDTTYLGASLSARAN